MIVLNEVQPKPSSARRNGPLASAVEKIETVFCATQPTQNR